MNTIFNKKLSKAMLLAIIVTLLMTTGALAAAGALDPTFGTGGIVKTDFTNGSEDNGMSIAIQKDGKIVMGGYIRTGDETLFADFGLARYNRNGSLDITFGTGGKVITDFGADEYGNDIAIQTDGKIVIVGCKQTTRCIFALARYNSNGSLDTTFGTGGIVTTSFPYNVEARAVAIQSDGKIVVAGSGNAINLVRYNSNGSLDSTFGTGGKVTILKGIGFAYDITILSDGKIIAAGYILNDYDNSNFVVARFNSNGSLDNAFGVNGLAETDLGGFDVAFAIALQSDGKIIVAGERNTDILAGDIALVRYNPTGSLDTTFSSDGIVTTHLGTNLYSAALDIVIQPDGKIVTAGYFYKPTLDTGAVVVRYTKYGNLDPTFGTNGKTIFSQSSNDSFSGVALQSDGKIVAGSSFYSDTNNLDFGLVRFEADLPKSIDYSSQMPPVGKQGNQGSCAAWAISYYYKSYQENNEHKWGYDYEHLFSPSYLYNQFATSNDWGPKPLELGALFEKVKQYGLAPLSEFVFNQLNWLPRPTETDKQVGAAYKILNYTRLYYQPGGGTVESLKEYLVKKGPFVITFPLYAGIYFDGWHPEIVDIYATVVDIPSASLIKVKDYGHAVLVVGYDDAKQRFKFINSWGPTWGENGFGYITYAFVLERFPYEAYGMTDLLNDPVAPTTCTSIPPRPSANTPNGGLSTNRRAFLDWFAKCSRTFEVLIRTDSSTGAIVDHPNNVPMSQYWTIPLTPGKTYFWTVRACNAKGCSPWMAYRSFKVSTSATMNP